MFWTPSTSDEFVSAIQIVRSSFVAPASRGYATESATEMPVLLMPMVLPECAGVSFTANPVTGDPEIVIEAVAGLGESLVSGETFAFRLSGNVDQRLASASHEC